MMRRHRQKQLSEKSITTVPIGHAYHNFLTCYEMSPTIWGTLIPVYATGGFKSRWQSRQLPVWYGMNRNWSCSMVERRGEIRQPKLWMIIFVKMRVPSHGSVISDSVILPVPEQPPKSATHFLKRTSRDQAHCQIMIRLQRMTLIDTLGNWRSFSRSPWQNLTKKMVFGLHQSSSRRNKPRQATLLINVHRIKTNKSPPTVTRQAHVMSDLYLV